MSLSGILFGTLLRPLLKTEENLETPQDSDKRLVNSIFDIDLKKLLKDRM